MKSERRQGRVVREEVGGVALGKGLRRARPARARRVCPVIRPRSRWAPSPAIKMLIGPAPPSAPRPGPPGREQRLQACPRGGPRPRPHFRPRRLRLGDKGAATPHPRPSGTPATQDEYAAAAVANATKRACGLRRVPRAGPACSHPHSLASRAEVREEAGRGAGGGAAPSSALPARPRTHAPGAARPPRAPGRSPRSRRAALHKVTACSDGCARAPTLHALRARPRPDTPPSHPCDLGLQ